MATGATTNLNLTTVEADDQLPEAVVKANFEVLDQYVAATEMTNKSGSQRTAGDVVVVDTTTDNSFTTTVTANVNTTVGVVQETIANNAAGIIKHYGTTTVKVTAATSRGNWLVTSTTAGQASPVAQAEPPDGAFALALSASAGAGTVTALLLASSANAITLSDTVALALGTASAGVAASASRVDHVHPGTTTHKYKSAAQVFTSDTAFADVAASSGSMSFAIAANEVWSVRYVVPLSFGGTGGIKFQLTGPAAPTAVTLMGWVANVARADGGAASGQATESFPVVTAFSTALVSLNSSNGLSVGTINYAITNPLVEIIATIANGANAGTVTLQAAQNSASSTTTLGVGSFMRAEKIA